MLPYLVCPSSNYIANPSNYVDSHEVGLCYGVTWACDRLRVLYCSSPCELTSSALYWQLGEAGVSPAHNSNAQRANSTFKLRYLAQAVALMAFRGSSYKK